MESEIIANFISKLGSSDLRSFINVLEAYLESDAFRKSIEFMGFNSESGYVYLTLCNDICIASRHGNNVDFLAFDDDGEEITFPNYYDALQYINQ